jgi:hypothetical protein
MNAYPSKLTSHLADPYLYFETPKPKGETAPFVRFFDRKCTAPARQTGPKIGKKAGRRGAVHRMFARPDDRNLHQVTSNDSEGFAATSRGRRPYDN